MLKNFMQPGTGSSISSVDSKRMVQSGYPASPPEASRQADAAKPGSSQPAKSGASDGGQLIVGPNIKLKGSEITDCEILVVEGRVEASMNSRDIRIAETGVFSGKAEIDVAEVRGRFEGELTARKRLIVYATGRVSGTIRYGAMMVEEGGVVSGNVALLDDPAELASTHPASATREPVQETVTALEEIRFDSAVAHTQVKRRA